MGSQHKQKTQQGTAHLLAFVFCAIFLTFCVIRASRNGRYDGTVTWLTQKGAVRVKALSAMAGLSDCSSTPSEPACAVKTEYVSSELEQAWLGNITGWQASFCSSLPLTEQLTQVWLRAQAAFDAALQRGDGNPIDVLRVQQLLDPRVFSQFKTRVDCGSGEVSEHVTWIEPLAHGLRHPDALCRRGTTVFNRTYLLPAHSSEVGSMRVRSRQGCSGRPCRAIYLDLGATILQPGPDDPGQGWFFHTYAKQGITFEQYLLWEAVPRSPAEVFKHVPKLELEKYHYYNIPVTADTADLSSPINILKRVAQPGDFVVFKLDIDTWAVENALVAALLADATALGLVDEFYFEDHVNFSEMLGWWDNTYNPKQYDPSRSLSDSYHQFLRLRQLGVRAHSWV